MSDKKEKEFVPNVAPKFDPKEQARLQAQIGNLRKQHAQFVVDETKKTRTLDPKGEHPQHVTGLPDEEETKKEDVKESQKEEGGDNDGSGKGINLKETPTLYFSKCKGGNYTVDHRITKVLIEGVEDTTININGKILTSTIEIWKCKNVTLNLNTNVKTLQIDLMEDINVNFSDKSFMHAIVWQHVEGLNLTFANDKKSNLKTGFAHIKELHPDSELKLDQFIVRFLEQDDGSEPVLTPERCVRLKNGFLSTEREAIDWEKRNEAAKDAYMAKFLKESGLRLNKSEGGKKAKPNEPCTCGSGAKFKKCCMNKKQVTGLAETSKPVTFK